MKNRLVVALLERSREKLRRNIWIKGVEAKNDAGRTVSPQSKSASCFCASGAVAACTKSEDLMHDAMEALNSATPPIIIYSRAYPRTIVGFNDAPETTKKDVLTVFSRAIKRLKTNLKAQV